MRSTINLGFVVAVSAATVHSAPQGYLAVVGPKPLMFARPSVPLALAISRLPALAAVTQPLRLTAGSLTIACSGPIAMELSHLAPELMARINGGLGRVAVEQLRFVQTNQPARAAAKPALPPRPVALPARVATALEG